MTDVGQRGLLRNCQGQTYSGICAIRIGCVDTVIPSQKCVAQHYVILAGASQDARNAKRWIILWDLHAAGELRKVT